MTYPSPTDKVYIDTMVFVYFLASTGGFLYSRATRFMQAMQNQKFIGVMSTFTMTEFVGVMKEILAEVFKRPPTQQEMAKSIKQLDTVIDSYGITLYDADQLAVLQPSTMFREADSIVLTTDPHLGTLDKEWHSLGGADAINVDLAQRCGAQFIATFDQGFSCLKTTTVKPLVIPQVF